MVGQILLTSSSRIHLLSRRVFSLGKLHSLVPANKIVVAPKMHPNVVCRRFQSSGSSPEFDFDSPGTQLTPVSPSPVVASTTAPTLWERFKAQTGLTTLLPEWKLMLSSNHLMDDLLAGITVGCVAVPLSLAIAMASGVSPEIGLVSGIVGGTVASFFGGAPLGVTGPSLATSVILAGIASTHGVAALVFVTCITGGLQILTGVMRLGGLVRFVPQPVIAGFTGGVGGVMLVGQLPKVLGIAGPEAPGLTEMATHVISQLSNIHPASMILALGTLATTFLLPKKFPKVPAALVAVTVAAGLNTLLGLGAPVIGALSCSFPSPAFPEAIDYETMYSLIGSSLALYGLTSLESLLSGSAADKIDREDPRKHNPNVDLVGQGLANVAVSCFGGIPVTGAIARTSLNITAGAKTRRAAIFHVGVLGGVFALGPVISLVPLSALSGILLSVALRLLNPKELKFLSKVSYREVVPLAATFGTVLMSDLVTGVQVGTVTAVAMQFTKHVPRFLSYTLAGDDDENLTTVRLAGDITFISASKISALRGELVAMSVSEEAPVVLDFSDIRSVDASASEMIVDIIYDMEELGHTPSTFKILGLSHEQERVLLVCDSRGLIEKFIHKIPHNVSTKSF